MHLLDPHTSSTIAAHVLTTFSALHAKYKPQPNQWTVLAGIVVGFQDGSFECVSLGTGVKCLPHTKVPAADGIVLHDSHAEVLAMRGFNVFLLSQAALASKEANRYLISTPEAPTPFMLNHDIRVYLFTTTSPCGDASMNTLIASSPDSIPWELPPPSTPASPTDSISSSEVAPPLRGRGYYSLLGSVRTKPGRADSPASWSKSCSDKISARMVLSVLGTPGCAVIAPGSVFLAGLVVPEKEFCDIGFQRAFEGRMERVRNAVLPGGYGYREMECGRAEVEVAFGKGTSKASAPVSCVWVKGVGCEALVNGVVQGRKAFSGLGTTLVSKRSIWERAVKVLASVRPGDATLVGNYQRVKERMAERGEAKRVLRECLAPWAVNGGNDIELGNEV